MYTFVANYLEPLCYLVYALVLYVRFRNSSSSLYTVLFSYYAFSAVLQFVASLLWKVDLDNNWAYNLFFMVTVIVLSWYFHQLLVKKSNKTVVKIFLAVNLLIFFVFVFLVNKFLKVYNANVFGFSFLSIVIYSLLYINQVMTNIREGNILLNFDFWLVSSYLIYFLGGFFVVVFYLNADLYQRAMIWSLLNIILFISSLIAAVGNYKIRRYEKSKP